VLFSDDINRPSLVARDFAALPAHHAVYPPSSIVNPRRRHPSQRQDRRKACLVKRIIFSFNADS
jgi:hypothetical protein